MLFNELTCRHGTRSFCLVLSLLGCIPSSPFLGVLQVYVDHTPHILEQDLYDISTVVQML